MNKIDEVVKTCKAIAKDGYARVGHVMDKAGLDQNDKTLLIIISSKIISGGMFIREPRQDSDGFQDYYIYKNPTGWLVRIQKISAITTFVISLSALILSILSYRAKSLQPLPSSQPTQVTDNTSCQGCKLHQ